MQLCLKIKKIFNINAFNNVFITGMNTLTELLTYHRFLLLSDGFGGLVVSILATGTLVRGFKSSRSR